MSRDPATRCAASEPFKVGQQVRHIDGTLGTVAFVHPAENGGYIEWKHCNQWRCSSPSALRDASNESFRWRKENQ